MTHVMFTSDIFGRVVSVLEGAQAGVTSQHHVHEPGDDPVDEMGSRRAFHIKFGEVTIPRQLDPCIFD